MPWVETESLSFTARHETADEACAQRTLDRLEDLRLRLEDRFDDALVDELGRRGHDVERWPPFTRDAAAVEAILCETSTGFLRAGADPRQPAYAIAV